jgi:outer membrane protein assembly factor BamB
MFELAADKPAAKVLWPVSTAPARRILSHTSTALLKDDCVYSAKSSGEFICLDAKTGRQLWLSTDVTELKGGASVHITANGKSELLYTDRGELIRARLTPEGYEEISRAKVLEPTFPFSGRNVAWSPPAYANGHIFARSGKELVCASLTEVP